MRLHCTRLYYSTLRCVGVFIGLICHTDRSLLTQDIWYTPPRASFSSAQIRIFCHELGLFSRLCLCIRSSTQDRSLLTQDRSLLTQDGSLLPRNRPLVTPVLVHTQLHPRHCHIERSLLTQDRSLLTQDIKYTQLHPRHCLVIQASFAT